MNVGHSGRDVDEVNFEMEQMRRAGSYDSGELLPGTRALRSYFRAKRAQRKLEAKLNSMAKSEAELTPPEPKSEAEVKAEQELNHQSGTIAVCGLAGLVIGALIYERIGLIGSAVVWIPYSVFVLYFWRRVEAALIIGLFVLICSSLVLGAVYYWLGPELAKKMALSYLLGLPSVGAMIGFARPNHVLPKALRIERQDYAEP